MFLTNSSLQEFTGLFVRSCALKSTCYLFPGLVFARKIKCMAESINRLDFLQASVFVRFVFHRLGTCLALCCSISCAKYSMWTM